MPHRVAAAHRVPAASERLVQVHQALRERLGALRQEAAPGGWALRRELDGLTAILEPHFSFEKRRFAAALDTLGPEAQFPEVFTAGGS